MSDHEHNWVMEEVSFLSQGGISTRFVCTICGKRMSRVVDSSLLGETDPIIPEPKEGEHRHCWHSTGRSQLMSPPKYGYICCICGESEYFWSSEFIPRKPNGHGPFAPKTR